MLKNLDVAQELLSIINDAVETIGRNPYFRYYSALLVRALGPDDDVQKQQALLQDAIKQHLSSHLHVSFSCVFSLSFFLAHVLVLLYFY